MEVKRTDPAKGRTVCGKDDFRIKLICSTRMHGERHFFNG